MSSPTQQRDKASRLARTDSVEALLLARAITDPWYRCQTLSTVARFAPDQRVRPIAEEAACASRECKDGYQRVAVMAWPVRALIERSRNDEAMTFVGEALEAASHIEHHVCRLDGLHLLWQAVFPLGPAARDRAQSALLAACTSANSWRAGRCMLDMAEVLASDEPHTAERIVALLRPGYYRNRGLRFLAAPTPGRSVRSFFH